MTSLQRTDAPTRIMLVDDHEILRDGIQMILSAMNDLQVVASLGDGRLALERVATDRPDVIIMDIDMPGMNGIEATYAIRERCPDAKIILLTAHSSAAYLHQALRVGANGFIIKKSAGTEIIKAVRTVAFGRNYFGTGITLPAGSRDIPADSRPVQPVGELSKREHQLLACLCSGMTNAEIARQLALSVKSVETYRSRLLKKLHLATIADLVRYAIRNGLISA